MRKAPLAAFVGVFLLLNGASAPALACGTCAYSVVSLSYPFVPCWMILFCAWLLFYACLRASVGDLSILDVIKVLAYGAVGFVVGVAILGPIPLLFGMLCWGLWAAELAFRAFRGKPVGYQGAVHALNMVLAVLLAWTAFAYVDAARKGGVAFRLDQFVEGSPRYSMLQDAGRTSSRWPAVTAAALGGTERQKRNAGEVMQKARNPVFLPALIELQQAGEAPWANQALETMDALLASAGPGQRPQDWRAWWVSQGRGFRLDTTPQKGR